MKKGFYVSLAVGAIAIAAVGVIAAQNTIGQEQQPEHLAQIENQGNGKGTKQPDKMPEQIPDKTSEQAPVKTQGTPDTQIKLPLESETPEDGTKKDTSMKPEKEPGKATEKEQEKPSEKAPEVSQVMTGAISVKNLSFQEEDGLIWPVMGKVVLDYSMDHSIYFKTLGQYKYNPALVIGAKEGTEVLSAAKCVVTDISENEETGVTVTAELGNGYEVVYGQLAGVKAKKGDTIEKGSVIGKIAAPTKYYIEEGSNLYFKVLENKEPVDPLLLLE